MSGYTLFGGGTSDPTKADRFTTVSRNSNFSPAAWTINLVDTTSGPVTATLPSANSGGEQIVVKWVAGTNPLTIVRSGSDTIGAVSTSVVMSLPMEVWELTSSGAGQWNLTAGNKTLASLDGRYGSNWLTTGEETMSREFMTSTAVSTGTQVLRLTYFTARKTETTTQVRVVSGGTAAGATPTLCRVGLYSVASNSDLTLVASIANDTSLFAATNTAYTRPWLAGYQKTAGQRYALGVLVVTAAAAPTMAGMVITLSAEAAADPTMSGNLSAQTDLPASVPAGSLGGDSRRMYAAILP